jgi:hypothetical protein
LDIFGNRLPDLGIPPVQLDPAVNTYAEPTVVTAGTSIQWKKSLSNYQFSHGWVLTYFLAASGTPPIALPASTADVDGQTHIILTPAATSRNWAAGQYEVQGFATNAAGDATVVPAVPAGTVVQIYHGFLKVLANLGTVDANYDPRSHVQRVVDMLHAVMEGRATDDVLDSSIEGVQIRRLPAEQLVILLNRYEAKLENEIARARAQAGMGTGRRIKIRFGPRL